MRILILNNYSVKRVSAEIKAGLKPSHHLYGIMELEKAGYELVIIDPVKNKFYDKLANFLNKYLFLDLGDIYMQMRAFKKRKEYDFVYAPCQTVTQMLGLLAYFGIYKKKIIAVVHHPVLIGRSAFIRKFSWKAIFKGHYKCGALSSAVADEINRIVGFPVAECMHWGPNLNYYNTVAGHLGKYNKAVDLISVGRTGRDYQILIDAFNNTDIRVEIYASRDSINQLSKEYSSNIKLIALEQAESLTYPEVIKLYDRSKIMAIPMFPQKTLAGLTSITDAIALGMPMIITANENLEINIEEEGAGLWVEGRDLVKWKENTTKILAKENFDHFSEASKEIAEKKYNSDIFFNELLELFKGV